MSPESPQTDSFEDLFKANFEDLWRFARRRTDSAAEADDVVSQVFAVAWRRRVDVPDSAERLWLFGVARNVLANERRSRARQHRLTLRLAANHKSVLETFEPAEAQALSLESLTDDEFQAVQLRYWDDLSVTEIAELLGCTPNAVSMRLSKARRRILSGIAQTDALGNGHVPVDPEMRTEDSNGQR